MQNAMLKATLGELEEPKLGGNPKGNYEEEARVPRGFPEEPSRGTFLHKPPILLVIVRTL